MRTTATDPLVSFLVLSYNNVAYLRECLDSIFAQTVPDFEILFLDDCSADGSLAVASTYSDDRLRIVAHERNAGLTPSYNEAVSLCRGAFIVNLDSDDAAAPSRTAAQLEAFARDPGLSVVGTHIDVIDARSGRHPDAEMIEAIVNQAHDFDRIETWVVRNNLVRSSTMMRRSLHEKVGLNQLGMLRAPDYDLWVRSLRAGCRFALLQERLTRYRLHARGLTYGDPGATFLELVYAFVRHLVPLIDERADYASLADGLAWTVENEEFAKLPQNARYRILAAAFRGTAPASFEDFLLDVAQGGPNDAEDLALGRRILASTLVGTQFRKAENLVRGLAWQVQQTENWRQAFAYEQAQSARLRDAHDFERQQAENWRKACLEEQESVRHWRGVAEATAQSAGGGDAAP